MDVVLNNGVKVMNVTPDEFKRLDELGYFRRGLNESYPFNEPTTIPVMQSNGFAPTCNIDMGTGERFDQSEKFTQETLSKLI